MTKRLALVSAAVMFAVGATMSVMATAPAANAASLTSLANLQAGDLIRGQSFSAVYYYGTDGFRYVFPNDKTYFTWYSNFDSVKWVSDADLTKIQIGGNVTYKPGAKMIKINSDPRVYVVSKGGLIRAIKSEAIAKSLYGTNWNKQIDDVPDGFFSNYKLGGTIDDASMFAPAAEKASVDNIGANKMLKAAVVVSITENGFSPATVNLDKTTPIRFVNNGSTKHAVSDEGGDWGTGTLQPGESFSKYFKNADFFTFYDKLGTAKGTLVVE